MWANKFRSPPFVFTGASCQYSYCVISFCESAKLSRKAHHGNLTITASIVVILFFIIAAKRSTWNTTSGTWVEFPVITKNTTRHLLRKWLRLTKTHQPASSLFWVIVMFFFFFSSNLLLFKQLFGNFCTLFTVPLFLSLNTVSHRASSYFEDLQSLKVT